MNVKERKRGRVKMENNKQQSMILNEGLWSVMWKLSWPAVIAMVLYGLNVVFDAVFVGRFIGEKALAGVSLAYPFTQISLGIGSFIGVGAGSLLSIVIGKRDQDTQRRLMGNVNYLIIISGILMTALGLIIMTPVLKILGAEGLELTYSQDYMRVALIGSIFWIGGLAYNMVVRAEGKMGTAAWMMGVGLAINIIANYIFIVIMEMGVEGAAWGTNIGMFIYAVLFFIYCRKGKPGFETNERRICRERDLIKQILSLGFPSLIMSIMYVIQGFVVMKALTAYGTTTDLAFYGAAFRLLNLFFTPIYGLMRALQPAVGINYGAGNNERVIKSFKIFAFTAFLLMLPVWLISMIFPDMMLGTMLPDKIFSHSEIMNFRILILVAPMIPIIMMAMTFWPAIERPKPAAIMGIARQLILYVPAMIILPRFFGIDWIYKGSFIIDFALSILVIFMIMKDFRSLREQKNIDSDKENISTI